MFYHICFADGSNSYLSIGIKDRKEMDNKIKKWRKNYILERVKTGKDGNRYYNATIKPSAELPNLFDFDE